MNQLAFDGVLMSFNFSSGLVDVTFRLNDSMLVLNNGASNVNISVNVGSWFRMTIQISESQTNLNVLNSLPCFPCDASRCLFYTPDSAYSSFSNCEVNLTKVGVGKNVSLVQALNISQASVSFFSPARETLWDEIHFFRNSMGTEGFLTTRKGYRVRIMFLLVYI